MALNRSRLGSNHFPFVPFRVTLGTFTEQTEALVDTGFDGDLVLPTGSIPASVAPGGELLWALADAPEVLAPAYLGNVQLDTLGSFPVVITVLGNEPIVGRGLTDRFRLTLDHGALIVVEL